MKRIILNQSKGKCSTSLKKRQDEGQRGGAGVFLKIKEEASGQLATLGPWVDEGQEGILMV